MREPLTPKQLRLFKFIKKYIHLNGYAPTLREMTDSLGVKSTANGVHYVSHLVAKGWLRKGTAHLNRNIAIAEPSTVLPAANNFCPHCGQKMPTTNGGTAHAAYQETTKERAPAIPARPTDS